MSLWRLIRKELLHRPLGLALGLLAVCVAVGSLVGAMVLLRAHDAATEAIISQKEAETTERMRQLEDEARKITKGMGFNVLILPKDQNLADLYADNYASKDMPQEYARKLANSKVVTVRHLLPSLQRKIKWPEKQRTIILVGTHGEVPIAHRKPKEPIVKAVAPGNMVLGYELHRSLEIELGDKVALMGREFEVSKLHPERGTRDDITIWIDLTEAQQLLDKEGRISAILALECKCAWADLAKVRKEISAILPDTQVIERAGKALARAEMRQSAASAAKAAVEAEKKNRADLRKEKEGFAAVLVPLVLLGAVVWIGLLAFGNVRDRRGEIGILRAIGLSSGAVLCVFVARAMLTGLIGGVLGYLAGWLIAGSWIAAPGTEAGIVEYLDVRVLVAVLVATPLVSAMAAWLPAMIGAQQDPAAVLQEE